MKQALLVLGVVAALLPLLLVGLLLLAVQWPRMDGLTTQMPGSVRTAVAAAVMGRTNWDVKDRPQFQRALKLDPENLSALRRECNAQLQPPANRESLDTCRHAAALGDEDTDFYNRGLAEDANGDECSAAQSFQLATQHNSDGNDYEYLEELGRSALRCGRDPWLAFAGLQGALDQETKDLKSGDLDEGAAKEERDDQLTDREFFVALQDHLHHAAARRTACEVVNPAWKDCTCIVKADNTAECTGH
jgi:tetratricopeptide (TPR) repeat protein